MKYLQEVLVGGKLGFIRRGIGSLIKLASGGGTSRIGQPKRTPDLPRMRPRSDGYEPPRPPNVIDLGNPPPDFGGKGK